VPQRVPIARLQAFGGDRSDRDRLRRRRQTALGRLYDSPQWRHRTQPHILARDPFCQIGALCGGDAPSTDVDHIVRAELYVKQHGSDLRYFFDEKNLRGACHADHSRKSAMERAGQWHEPVGGSSFAGGGADDRFPLKRTAPQQKIFQK
jgi:hypothetical protein